MLIGAALLLAGCATAGHAGAPFAGRAADSAAQSGQAQPPPGSSSRQPARRNSSPDVAITTDLTVRQIWSRLMEAAERGRITPDVVQHIFGISPEAARPTPEGRSLVSSGTPADFVLAFHYRRRACAEYSDPPSGLCDGSAFHFDLLVHGPFGEEAGGVEQDCAVNSRVVERLVAAGWIVEERGPQPPVSVNSPRPWPGPFQLHRTGGHIDVEPSDDWGPGCVTSIRIFQSTEGR